MGQAVRNAEVLSSNAHALTIAASGETDRAHIAQWRASGRELHRIETVRVAGGTRNLGSNPGIGSAAVCQGLLALSGLEATTLQELVEQTGLVPAPVGSRYRAFGDPSACFAAISKARRMHDGASAAVLISQIGQDGPDASILNRVAHLSDAAEAGQVLTDYQSAMIARVLLPDIQIEEMGEISSLSGPIRLWSMSP